LTTAVAANSVTHVVAANALPEAVQGASHFPTFCTTTVLLNVVLVVLQISSLVKRFIRQAVCCCPDASNLLFIFLDKNLAAEINAVLLALNLPNAVLNRESRFLCFQLTLIETVFMRKIVLIVLSKIVS